MTRGNLQHTEAILMLLLQGVNLHFEQVFSGTSWPSGPACLLDGIEFFIILSHISEHKVSTSAASYGVVRSTYWLMRLWILLVSNGRYSFSLAAFPTKVTLSTRWIRHISDSEHRGHKTRNGGATNSGADPAFSCPRRVSRGGHHGPGLCEDAWSRGRTDAEPQWPRVSS